MGARVYNYIGARVYIDARVYIGAPVNNYIVARQYIDVRAKTVGDGSYRENSCSAEKVILEICDKLFYEKALRSSTSSSSSINSLNR